MKGRDRETEREKEREGEEEQERERVSQQESAGNKKRKCCVTVGILLTPPAIRQEVTNRSLESHNYRLRWRQTLIVVIAD